MTETQVTDALIRLKIKNPKNRKLYGKHRVEQIQAGRANGSLAFLESQGQLRAGIWEFDTSEYFPGVKVRIVEFALRSGDKAALRWLKDEIRRRSKHYSTKTFIFLDKNSFIFLKMFCGLGFSIESLVLTGKPGPALSALMRVHKPPRDLVHLGLSIEKITRERIGDALRVNRQEFLRNPKHGWFCAEKTFLKLMREELTQAIKKRDHSHYLILRGKKVVGYFAATEGIGQRKGTAGVTFVFDRSIQGRGIVKTAYRILLEDMRRKKIKIFSGGTSQKSVLALGKLMKRKPLFFILRYGSMTFTERHFGSW